MMNKTSTMASRVSTRESANPAAVKSPRHQPQASLEDGRTSAIAQARLVDSMQQTPWVRRHGTTGEQINNSPRQLMQRKKLDNMIYGPVQKQGIEEEPVQGQFATIQRQPVEDEELQMQAAPGTFQRRSLEDEELLQGKMAPVQRQDGLEVEELLQGKFDPVQRQGLEDEELLQGRFASREIPAQPQEVKAGIENRTGMPDQLKAGLEQLSGMDLSGVRVHRNSAKPAQLNALAYAQGHDIHLGPGQEKHLPHEGWHAVQQMQGRVKPTMQAKGMAINDDEGLEREADLMGAKAMWMRRSEKSAPEFPTHPYARVDPVRQTIQRRVDLEMIGSVIKGATKGQIISWLGRYDREYNTLYRAEAESLDEKLDEIVSDDVSRTYGFLRAPAFVRNLRTRAKYTGPDPRSAAGYALFGLDGKDLKAIKSALKVGYRQFDTAETYGNLEQLATALEDTGLPRKSYRIVYKIEAKGNQAEASKTLWQAVSKFEYFDSVLIHNAREAEKAVLKTWSALCVFKKEGKALKIGVGNFGPKNVPLLKKLEETQAIDVVELEAFELLLSIDLVNLVKSMEVDVLYYQIVQMAKTAGMDTSPESLAGLIETVDSLVGRGFPILSSGSKENQKKNLEAVSENVDSDYGELEKLDKTISAGRTCTKNGPEVNLGKDALGALKKLVASAASFREAWKGKDLGTAIRNCLPTLTPVLTLEIPERKGLKRVYVGRSGESVIKALLGPSSCDHKWSIELLQLLLMSCNDWEEFGNSSLSNIV